MEGQNQGISEERSSEITIAQRLKELKSTLAQTAMNLDQKIYKLIEQMPKVGPPRR
ncbi:MAG: hypothetical protein ABIE03_06300 [Patescibacteria group bacterium]|nr:hypothetical protein [Patescibacteria group bacterium]